MTCRLEATASKITSTELAVRAALVPKAKPLPFSHVETGSAPPSLWKYCKRQSKQTFRLNCWEWFAEAVEAEEVAVDMVAEVDVDMAVVAAGVVEGT